MGILQDNEENYKKTVKEFTKKLRDLRKLKGIKEKRELTPGIVSAEIGIHYNSLANYEFDRIPLPEQLIAICKYYGVSSDELLGLEQIEKTNIDLIKISEITGLSLEAVSTLIELKNKYNGFLIDTINFLIEQEKFPFEQEMSHQMLLEDISKSKKSDEQKEAYKVIAIEEYKKDMKAWNSLNLQHVLMAIDSFFKNDIKEDEKLYLIFNSLKGENEFPSPEYRDAVTKKVIMSKNITNRVFLDEINEMILKAKEKLSSESKGDEQ